MLRKLCLGLVLAGALGAKHRPRPHPALEVRPFSWNYEISFRDQLRMPGALKLSGREARRSVSFLCETARRPGNGSDLHLFLEHSPSVDPNRSFLTITLNYGILRSVRLDEENAQLSEVAIPLPAGLLKPENELVFGVEQHPVSGAAPGDLWTAISPRSYIAIRSDSELLPAPLVDPYSYRSKAFDVLLPPEPASAETLEAMGLLVANYCARVAPEPVAVNLVRSASAARHPLLVAGTLKAARDLLRLGPPEPRGKLRAWTRAIPPASRFSLARLGLLGELKFTAQNNFSVTVPLEATPDSRFFSHGTQMTLALRLDPEVISLNGEVAVDLNGTGLGSFPAREITKGSTAQVTVKIPPPLLQTRSVLRVALRGPMEKTAQPSPGALLPNSQFHLPRDYQAELPDLSLLEFHLFPFSLNADLSDTIIVVPQGGSAVTATVVELAGNLGRLLPTDRINFRIRRAGEVLKSEAAGSHLIILGANASSRGSAMVEEVSPWNSDKFVLRITARSVEALPQAVRALFSSAVLSQLSGDTAYVGAGGVRCLRTAARRSFEEYNLSAHVEAWFRANWVALPAILSVVSGLLFAGLRLALEHYKNGRGA